MAPSAAQGSSLIARVSLLAVAGMLLTGCTAQPVDVAGPPTETSTPAPPVTQAPFPTVDRTCEEILPAAVIVGVYGSDLAAAPFLAKNLGGSPRDYAVLHEGGTQCRWGTADANIVVSLLPHPGENWQTYVDYYAVQDGRESVCPEGSATCTGNVLTPTDVWISVTASGMPATATAAFEKLFGPIEQSVTDAALISPEWEPQSDAPLGNACDAISDTNATAAFASPEPLTSSP